jgi:hypothetical protein
MPGLQRMPILAQGECHRWQPDKQRGRPLLHDPGFSIMSLIEPLSQAPQVIPQLIMSLCAISIVTFNKRSEVMTPFYGGNKNRPRINVTTGDKTFDWLFDTGAAVTCMNANSFRQAFSGKQPRLLHKGTGSKMNSLGVFELPMKIRGRSFFASSECCRRHQ